MGTGLGPFEVEWMQSHKTHYQHQNTPSPHRRSVFFSTQPVEFIFLHRTSVPTRMAVEYDFFPDIQFLQRCLNPAPLISYNTSHMGGPGRAAACLRASAPHTWLEQKAFTIPQPGLETK